VLHSEELGESRLKLLDVFAIVGEPAAVKDVIDPC
jgi:hypothetical protein